MMSGEGWWCCRVGNLATAQSMYMDCVVNCETTNSLRWYLCLAAQGFFGRSLTTVSSAVPVGVCL